MEQVSEQINQQGENKSLILNSKSGSTLDPNIILRKGIYDKVAAKLILQRYLDFHNSEDDKLVVPKTVQKR